MQVAVLASEVAPFAKTGGLGDVTGSLPLALGNHGVLTHVFMPLYRKIDPSAHHLTRLPKPFRLPFHPKHPAFALWTLKVGTVTTYFIDAPHYFDRVGLYGEMESDYLDNAMRFQFFSLAALHLIDILNLDIQVLHCNDWQTGLVPLLRRLYYAEHPVLGRAKCLFTIHNLAFQGVFPKAAMAALQLPESAFSTDGLEFWGQINFLKAGLNYADAISTVSKNYTNEIQTPALGCGLDGVIRNRSKVLHGILNGIDTGIWNPETDPHLSSFYSAKTLDKKVLCKRALCDQIQVDDASILILGMVTRLSSQKGIDSVIAIAPYLCQIPARLVILGTGDSDIEVRLLALAERYPEHIHVQLRFEEAFAHQIYAGADLFLMPSLFEPCGLGQLIALEYGTVPIVRKTGGLADTVQDAVTNLKGNGFVFNTNDPLALLFSTMQAVAIFEHKKDRWIEIQTTGMSGDHSWNRSAAEYVTLYQTI